MPEKANDIIKELQRSILSLQGYKPMQTSNNQVLGFNSIESAFPNHTFPTGAVHEFITNTTEDAASTNGFVTGILSRLMQNNGACIWISSKRTLFPPALKAFGIEPHKFIFINIKKSKEQLWAMEEALKCEQLTAVVGEIRDIDFTESRRLQLAVENSNVTGFVLRHQLRTQNIIASVSRWKITSLHSIVEEDMPGVGFPAWDVTLEKVRNGKPGNWQLQWLQNRFQSIDENVFAVSTEFLRKIV
jgi:protein ImuA